jgi:carbon starvation protein
MEVIGKEAVMDALIMMVLAFAGYIVMYRVYGQFIGKKIFALSGETQPPSVTLEDGVDYVPTKKEVIFGHHFTSIAGTGPIVGPAIAIIWGWVPALLWVFVGSIVMGAVHDFGALIISMRNQGKSISDYTAKYINSRTRFLFFLIVFLELWIVIAIFGLVIAIIFAMYPQSVLPCGWKCPSPWLPRLPGLSQGNGRHGTFHLGHYASCTSSCFIGPYIPMNMPAIAGIPATGVWTIILLIYAFFASVLPVTTLLQPRDFINSHQLVIAMVLLILGVLTAAFSAIWKSSPRRFRSSPAQAPPMWPFLFITIACGAISGFHSLVSSGTSAKQVRSEDDSLFVGYGSMLMEGALATLVIIAVAAGIGMGYTTKSGETLTGRGRLDHPLFVLGGRSRAGIQDQRLCGRRRQHDQHPGHPQAVHPGHHGGLRGLLRRHDPGHRHPDPALRPVGAVHQPQAGVSDRQICCHLYRRGTACILAFATGAGGKGALKLWPPVRRGQPDPGSPGADRHHPLSENQRRPQMDGGRHSGGLHGRHDPVGGGDEPVQIRHPAQPAPADHQFCDYCHRRVDRHRRGGQVLLRRRRGPWTMPQRGRAASSGNSS